MSIAGRVAAVAGIAMLAGVAGCSMGGGYRQPGPIAVAPQTGVEGSWIDQQGTGVNNFRGGRFQTFASDTSQKLSEGQYVVRPDGIVEISGMSLIRQSPVAFNCAVTSPSQLNCTSSTGQQFVLMRRTGVS
jgi:hypothetical protein